LALALLLGVRDNLDHELAAAYQAAGCSHVLALSGMHLAIISGLIAFFLKKPLGLRAAAAGGALFILAYVFLVGWQPSLGRAAIMYLLGTLVILGNLPRRPGLILGISFLVQLMIDPASGDRPSFILSYLALFGILHTGEDLHGLFRGILPETLAKPLAASVGAFIATQTAVVLFFGVLRPVGVAAGLVVVPLITLFMGLSMAWLVTDLLFPLLSGPLGAILAALYRILGRSVTLAARAPGINAPHPAAVLGVSLGLFFLLAYFRGRREKSREALVPVP
jgi:competence protein ComEC